MSLLNFLQERNFANKFPTAGECQAGHETVDIPCLILAADSKQVIFAFLGGHYRISADSIVDFVESPSVSCLPGSSGYPLMLKVNADAEISAAACTTAQALVGNAPAIFRLPHAQLSEEPRKDLGEFHRDWMVARGLLSPEEADAKIRATELNSMTKGDSTPITHETTCWGSASGEGEGIHIDDSHEDDTRQEPVLDPLENDDF